MQINFIEPFGGVSRVPELALKGVGVHEGYSCNYLFKLDKNRIYITFSILKIIPGAP